MKIAIPLVAFNIVGEIAFAQGASDPMANLRACSVLERAERLECLENRSRNVAPPARPAPAGEDWIVSETTSPVDYTPIVTATTFSRGGADGSAMQLSIHCRGGRTQLVVEGAALSGSSKDYAISYRINGDQPVHLAASSPSFGTGAAFTGDVVRLLQSLPEDGNIAVRLSPRTGADQEGQFFLAGLKMARKKVAAACNWPHVVAKPRNQGHRNYHEDAE
jgi:hypothetical protein